MSTDEPRDVQITVGRNGPYVVKGTITITDHDDVAITTPPGAAVALCRCGRSANKPFCDGSHAGAGFDGTVGPDNRTVS